MANACGRTRGSLRDPTPAKKRPQNLTAAFWRPRRVARQFGARRRIVIGGIHSRREMIKWNQKGRHDLRRVFLFGAGYGNRTRLLGLGSRCTTDVLILQIWIALRAIIREYSGGGAASVTLRILIWRGRQICVRCAPAALTRQKCLCSPRLLRCRSRCTTDVLILRMHVRAREPARYAYSIIPRRVLQPFCVDSRKFPRRGQPAGELSAQSANAR